MRHSGQREALSSLLFACLIGCSSGAGGTASDAAGSDVGATLDAASDPAADPAADTESDAAADAAADAVVDAAADAAADIESDPAADPVSDTTADTPEDTAIDAAADAAADAVVDTAADTLEPDLATDVPPASSRGTCESSVDCRGRTCLRVPDVEGGWGTCESRPDEATSCRGGGPDECCNTAECVAGDGGACFLGPLFYCGGARPIPSNICVADECASDEDCSGEGMGVCVPAGAWREPMNRCVFGDCRLDSDCGSRAGGQCMAFIDPCAGRFGGFHCTYDDSECRSDAVCGPDHCMPGDDGRSYCEPFFPRP